MQSIIDFLSSPVWQGIQGLLALIAILLTWSRPRQWLSDRVETKWILHVPWAWVLIASGIIAGISTGLKFKNIHLGLFVASATAALGMGIQWLQTHFIFSKLQKSFNRLTSNYKSLLKQVGHLQLAEFSLKDWNICHSVDNNGDGKLIEEVTIVPIDAPVYYYFVRYSIVSDSLEDPIKISAKNLPDGTDLSVFEVEDTKQSKKFMVILDPPSTTIKPKRIRLVCERQKIWRRLIKNNQDEGSILTIFDADTIHFEIMAPRNNKWKAFYPTPDTGKVKIQNVGNFSRVTWDITKPTARKHFYTVFLEPES